MKINKTLLFDTISSVIGVINKKSPIFEMKNLHISHRDNVLKLSATNTDSFITYEVQASGDPIDLCVNAVMLQNIIKASTGQLTLQEKNNHLVIQDTQGEFRLKCFHSAKFPSKQITYPKIFTIDGLTLVNMFKTVNIGVNDEELGMCRIILSNNSLTVVVNDRKRLSFLTAQITQKQEDFDLFISGKTMTEVIRSVSGDCNIFSNRNEIGFQTNNVTIISRLISAKYMVDHTKFTNLEGYTAVILNTSDLISGVRRALIMSQVISKIIYLNFNGNKLEITGMDIAVGDSKVTLVTGGSDAIGSLAVNGTFLEHALNCCHKKEINLYFKVAAPLIIVEEATHVLMPIRVGV